VAGNKRERERERKREREREERKHETANSTNPKFQVNFRGPRFPSGRVGNRIFLWLIIKVGFSYNGDEDV
jgi:hypothetical protein